VGLERGPLSPWEDKWGATWKKSSGSSPENWDYWPWGIRRADHATPLYPQKLALNFGNRWLSLGAGIVRLQTKGHGVCFWLLFQIRIRFRCSNCECLRVCWAVSAAEMANAVEDLESRFWHQLRKVLNHDPAAVTYICVAEWRPQDLGWAAVLQC
jgi:hypothetical protein